MREDASPAGASSILFHGSYTLAQNISISSVLSSAGSVFPLLKRGIKSNMNFHIAMCYMHFLTYQGRGFVVFLQDPI